jgi:DNA-binding transcriptional LysR family regulator
MAARLDEMTEAGGAYFRRCETLLSELESAEAEASALGEEFLARHPRLSIDLNLSNRYVDLVEEQYDVAFRVGALGDSRLVARRLAPNKYAPLRA